MRLFRRSRLFPHICGRLLRNVNEPIWAGPGGDEICFWLPVG